MCEISIEDINGSDKYPDARTIGRKFEPFFKTMRPIEEICKSAAKVIRNLRKHGNKADSFMTHDTELINKLCEHLNVERNPEKTLGKRLVTELLKKY